MDAEESVRLGYQARKAGDRESALRHYRTAVALYRGLANPLALAHTLRHVGDILRSCGDLKSARPYYEEALAIYRDYDRQHRKDQEHDRAFRLDLANAERGFALLHESCGEIAEATKLWQKAKSLYEALDLQAGADESRAHLAKLDDSQP